MKRKLVYIMSPSFSGSTLLTYLLASHPEIATIGELKATAMGDVDKYLCSCGQPIMECGFWRVIKNKLNNKGHNFTLTDFGTHYRTRDSHLCDRAMHTAVRSTIFEMMRNAYFKLNKRCTNLMASITERNNVLIEAVCDELNAPVFLDGSKDPSRFMHMERSNIWDMKLIFLIRDGRGVASSFMRRRCISMKKAAHEWNHAVMDMNNLVEQYNNFECLKIRYEDLCASPESVLNNVYDYIGVESVHGNPEYDPTQHHILGNMMRLSPVKSVSLNEKWRDELSDEDKETFDKVSGKLNQSFGYE